MLNIGITGHRALALVDRLEVAICQALEQIEHSYPGQEWNVISSLAEGADRFALLNIWKFKPGAHLIVPLPLPSDEYQRDFVTKDSRLEFRSLLDRATEVIPASPTGTRPEAYREAGLNMLAHSQVLLALWDGSPARSRGGTGEIVALARAQGLPLAWVHCANSASPAPDQGQLSLERFPAVTV